MNERRETARRWVIEDHKTDQEIVHLIVIGYDEGPARTEMEGHVNDARAELKWWTRLEAAYRSSGYLPGIDLVAPKLEIGSKTLRKQCREHGLKDWHAVHRRFT